MSYVPNGKGRSTWMTHLVKHLTFGFSSGHDCTVRGFKSHIGLGADSVKLLGILSLSSLQLPCLLALSLKINKQTNKKKTGREEIHAHNTEEKCNGGGRQRVHERTIVTVSTSAPMGRSWQSFKRKGCVNAP